MTLRFALRTLAASAAVSFVCSLSAHAAEPVKTVESGKLTYGVAATFAPFEFTRGGALTGFDIGLINAVAKEMKLAPDAQNMQFSGLIPALQGGRLDIINSAMYITPARSGQVDFVPYLRIGNRIIVQASNPAKITGRDDTLCGKNVAVTLGGIEETYARADVKRCKDAGKPSPNVMTLPTAQDSALSLRQGRADAIYNSTPGTVQLLAEVPDTYKAVGPEFEQTTSIGFAVPKGNTAMAAALKDALAKVVAKGTYGKLIEKWKLPASVSIFDASAATAKAN
ncbi:Lysine-arginine-ornithine-binding periplasmic protein precursor [Candidatus Burkholderia verschuerenii]|uniref:Lysine-arginine-ornithine-binding periplasmic protein n=1 Tax=Candidatus Burkholderia verschuerenii TaxID=242163 RepID=A0A0L0LX54_9BURK|nr:ABC transporter substrate-binding protein [Candidatus Burkholderia verschuerenii]KND54449.1 Lysine-arginine-ornithine-binding periplasmic protein precursor [Candidatus Burkholderia verschuerenii]